MLSIPHAAQRRKTLVRGVLGGVLFVLPWQFVDLAAFIRYEPCYRVLRPSSVRSLTRVNPVQSTVVSRLTESLKKMVSRGFRTLCDAM